MKGYGVAALAGARKALAEIERSAIVWWRDCLSYLPLDLKARANSWTSNAATLDIYIDKDGNVQSDVPMTIAAEMARTRLVSMRLDESQFMSRRVDVPKAALTDLNEVVRANFSIWTPFQWDEAYAAGHLLHGVAARGTAPTGVIELRFALRSSVSRFREAAAAMGLSPDVIIIGNPDYQFVFDTPKCRRMRRGRTVLAILACLMLGQIVALYALVWASQEDKITRLEAAKVGTTRELRRLTDERHRVEQRSRGLEEISARLNPRKSISNVIDALSKVLPSDAGLAEMQINKNGDSYVVVAASPQFDAGAALAATRLFRVKDVSMRAAPRADQKLFTVVVEFSEMTRSDAQRGTLP